MTRHSRYRQPSGCLTQILAFSHAAQLGNVQPCMSDGMYWILNNSLNEVFTRKLNSYLF